VNHEQLKAIALNRGDVKAKYDALEAEFALLQQILAARQRAGLTQAEIAQRMGSKICPLSFGFVIPTKEESGAGPE